MLLSEVLRRADEAGGFTDGVLLARTNTGSASAPEIRYRHFFVPYEEWFVGCGEMLSWLVLVLTASSVRPSFNPITLAGVFRFASGCGSCHFSLPSLEDLKEVVRRAHPHGKKD